jgi:hypothetical protein
MRFRTAPPEATALSHRIIPLEVVFEDEESL